MTGAPQVITLAQYSAMAGSEVGRSDWILIDQDRINAFADVTLDRQYIHIDPEQARSTAFGGTIAHGFLTLSLLSHMAQTTLPALDGATASVNYGMNSLRFVTPVRCDQRVRGRFVLKGISERSAGVQQAILSVIVDIDHEDKPALVCEWVVLFYV